MANEDDRRANVSQAVLQYIEHLKSNGHPDRDDDFENKIFEAAVELVAGSDAFDRINLLIDAREKHLSKDWSDGITG